MLVKNIYINGVSCISPQPTFEFGISQVRKLDTDFSCLEPDYKKYFNVNTLRRYSRMLRFSILTAQTALKDAQIEQPDAIITGTGLGCLEDSEKFLKSIIEFNEENLSPTAFIFSTHNTISGQIALSIQCKNSNNTFSNRYFSFESSLLESVFLIKDNDAQCVLVGASDEKNNTIQTITKHLNVWTNPFDGTSIGGEAACYLVISSEKNIQSYAEIIALKLNYKLEVNQKVVDLLLDFLEEAQIDASEIDFVVSGETEFDFEQYNDIYNALPNASIATYKHLIGQSFTASSFGYYLAAHILKNSPKFSPYFKGEQLHKKAKYILVYNQVGGKYHSFALLGHV